MLSLVRTNKRTNSCVILNRLTLSYPETVDIVLILVDSKCHKVQLSQKVSFLIRLIVFVTFELFVRLFVRSKPHTLQTMALFGANYGSFLLKVPQTLIAGTSFSDSGNVKRW